MCEFHLVGEQKSEVPVASFPGLLPFPVLADQGGMTSGQRAGVGA